MRTLPLCLATLTCLAALTGCEGASDGGPAALALPETPYNYADLPLPDHFTNPFVRGLDNTPADNPVTDHGANLGRVLFYDKALSANGTISCASCHMQEYAFADPARFSVGFDGGLTGRNAMGIADARFYRNGRFFWDERAATLEEQVLMPIQNEVEMGLTLEELVARVEAREEYQELFALAFGDSEVTVDRISKALAQFVRAIVSYRAPYDEGLEAAGDVMAPFPNYTAEENLGKQLFLGRAGCAACHLDSGPPRPGPRPNQAVFFIDIAVNNGLDADVEGSDGGVGDITGEARDVGRFKSPSLRNVALTGPYMHDGRFETLREVVEHYNTGVEAHPNLDRRLAVPNTNPPEPRRLNLTEAEIDALVAFMETLTDSALVEDPRYASPFVEE